MNNLVDILYPVTTKIMPVTTIPKEQGSVTWTWKHPNKKIALITGIGGQDGSYMAEWLLHNNYTVYGIARRASTNNLERIRHILDKILLIEGDITDSVFIYQTIEKIKPNEIYNLAAQSHVQTSFSNPDYTYRVNTLGLLNILNAVKELDRDIRVYQASTSEMFGKSKPPQGINTPFLPQSPYAVSKLSAHELVNFYKRSYGLFAVSGILFNHESPRRGENFVTKKIIKYLADPEVNLECHGKLKLGNVSSKRDWGFAPEYIKVMWSSLQGNDQTNGINFVLGTGRSISVLRFLDLVGEYLQLDWTAYVDTGTEENIRDSDVDHLESMSTPFFLKTDVWGVIKIMADYELGFPEPTYNNSGFGDGYDYYMENYGKIFAWRT